MRRVVLLAMLMALIASPLWAATYHVQQAAGGDATTITGGLALLNSGDTLVIHAGTYNEGKILLNGVPAGGGSYATATVITKAANEARPKIIAPFGEHAVDCGGVTGSRWWIIRGLEIDGTSNAFDGGINCQGGSSRIRFEDIVIHHMDENGFLADGSFMEFIDNEVYEVSQRFGDPGNPECEAGKPCNPGHGFYVAGSDHLFVGNYVHDCHPEQCYGYHLYTFISNTTLIGNRATRTGRGGIMVSGSGNVLINNIFDKNQYDGFQLQVDNTIFYHNTVFNNGVAGLWVTGGTVDHRNNIYYLNGVGTDICGGCTSGAANNFTSNPGFVSDVGGDYKIADIGSPAIGAAPRLASVTTDIEGSTRNDPTEPGAYVFDGAVEPPQPPPMGLVGEWLFEANANSTAAVPDSNPVRFHHGTLTGNASIQAPGLVGAGKLVLDGNGDYVQIPGHLDLAPATEFIIFARIRPASLPGRQEIYSAGDSIGFFQEAGNLGCFYFNGSSWPEAKTATPVVTADTVQHVACGKTQGASGQADSLRIWHEASQVAFLATTGTISYTLGPNVFIGQHGNGGGSYFSGDIDSVRFYANTRPTLPGIQNDFNELTPQIGLSVRDMAFTQADAPEGQVLGINMDRTHRLGSAIGLRFSITKGSE